ncbi:hypothetical protein [Tsuneonella sp. SYSU-LHT278]|uniref:hypothetical protein n=1 Tax=Tsuneonella sediminis TaxID=3416089 RepID=UPI003F79375E
MRWVRNEGYFERMVMYLIALPLMLATLLVEWPSKTASTIALVAAGTFAFFIAPIAARPLLDRWSRKRK